MRKKILLFLLVLSAISLGLRLWKLGEIPISLHWDEASIGYNAYSILKTGNDEYGNSLPLIFKAFGDYKAPMYVYLTVPSVAVFGLNEFAVRFPAAVFGVLNILLVYLLVTTLFAKEPGKYWLGLVASTLLMFSPWNFHYSRGAWEANILLFFMLLGVICYLKAGKRTWLISLSAISFGLCFYVYNSARLLVPLVVIGLLFFDTFDGAPSTSSGSRVTSRDKLQFLNRGKKRRFLRHAQDTESYRSAVSTLSIPRGLRLSSAECPLDRGVEWVDKEKIQRISAKNWCISGAVFVIMILPVVNFTFFGGASGRLRIMSIFSYSTQAEEISKITDQENYPFGNLEYKLFHNNLVFYSRGIVNRYLNHFSPRFLFFEGDWANARHGTLNSGVLNLLDILFIPLGVYYLLSKKIKNQGLIWFLLLISPLPAVLTRDVVQATKSYTMILPLTIISAWGIYCLWESLRQKAQWVKVGVLFGLGGIYLFGFVYYLDQFFIHAPQLSSKEWQYGYKQVVEYIAPKVNKYQQVIFTQKYGQPYIYWLFYTQYDPKTYQVQSKLIEDANREVGRVDKIDNIFFRNLYWPADRLISGRLYLGTIYELPESDIVLSESTLLRKIDFLDGEPAFMIVETKNSSGDEK